MDSPVAISITSFSSGNLFGRGKARLASADHHHPPPFRSRRRLTFFSRFSTVSLHLPKRQNRGAPGIQPLFSFSHLSPPAPDKAKSSTAWCCTTPLPTILPLARSCSNRPLAGATMVFGFWFGRSTRCASGLTWFFLCALAGRSKQILADLACRAAE